MAIAHYKASTVKVIFVLLWMWSQVYSTFHNGSGLACSARSSVLHTLHTCAQQCFTVCMPMCTIINLPCL